LPHGPAVYADHVGTRRKETYERRTDRFLT
jgi:hypothetical protein